MNASVLQLLEKVDSGVQLSNAEKGAIVRDLRKSKLRRPDVVLRFAEHAQERTLGEIDELNLFEQISLASMDLGEQGMLDKFMQKLSKRFPSHSSSRMERLRGMKLESEGKFSEALALYTEVLKKNPSNMLIMKRIACIYRQQGLIQDAVNELHKILKLFSSDATTWLELSEIHLSRGEFAEAAHCLEELVMLDPDCAHFNTRLADTYYSIGGAEHLILARKHYTLSLNRQSAKVNLRALYGLMASCRALLAAEDSLEPSQRELTKTLLQFARDQVDELCGTGDSCNVVKL